MFSATFTHRTTATAQTVFDLWSEVAEWPTWDDSLTAATLAGAFDAGTSGTLQPAGMPEPFPFTLIEVVPGTGFTDETLFGPMTLRFRHEAVASGRGTLITLVVEVEGPDAEQVGRDVTSDSHDSLVALARAAEARTLRA